MPRTFSLKRFQALLERTQSAAVRALQDRRESKACPESRVTKERQESAEMTRHQVRPRLEVDHCMRCLDIVLLDAFQDPRDHQDQKDHPERRARTACPASMEPSESQVSTTTAPRDVPEFRFRKIV